MDTVFVRKGSSKSYTNLITSSAPIPFEKKKLSQEPIGQKQEQQQPLGINNVETETSHRRENTAAVLLRVRFFFFFTKSI